MAAKRKKQTSSVAVSSQDSKPVSQTTEEWEATLPPWAAARFPVEWKNVSIHVTKSLGKFQAAAQEVGDLVESKNQAYGNSFGSGGKFLEILYPNGVLPHQYDDMLAVVRVFDKLMRVATNKTAFSEEPWKDICGYALLGLVKEIEKKVATEEARATAEGSVACDDPATDP